MKKLIFIVTVAFSSISNAQCYTSLTQSQNKLLDKYGIDYTGLQTRYIMSTNRINNIKDPATKSGMMESYAKFIKWNNGRLEVLPDTAHILETASNFIKNKTLTEESKTTRFIMTDDGKILNNVHIDINQDDIKSIEIIEIYHSNMKDCLRITHMIFVENTAGSWYDVTYDNNDTTLDCPFCTVP
jgi:hypothetical protein